MEKPAIAPIIECVVDTGNPKVVASNNQAPAASKLAIIPKTKMDGESS